MYLLRSRRIRIAYMRPGVMDFSVESCRPSAYMYLAAVLFMLFLLFCTTARLTTWKDHGRTTTRCFDVGPFLQTKYTDIEDKYKRRRLTRPSRLPNCEKGFWPQGKGIYLQFTTAKPSVCSRVAAHPILNLSRLTATTINSLWYMHATWPLSGKPHWPGSKPDMKEATLKGEMGASRKRWVGRTLILASGFFGQYL